MRWLSNVIAIIRWLPTYFKEIAGDIVHVSKHFTWLHRDDKTRHWHCTLCDIDLSAIKSGPKRNGA